MATESVGNDLPLFGLLDIRIFPCGWIDGQGLDYLDRALTARITSATRSPHSGKKKFAIWVVYAFFPGCYSFRSRFPCLSRQPDICSCQRLSSCSCRMIAVSRLPIFLPTRERGDPLYLPETALPRGHFRPPAVRSTAFATVRTRDVGTSKQNPVQIQTPSLSSIRFLPYLLKIG